MLDCCHEQLHHLGLWPQALARNESGNDMLIGNEFSGQGLDPAFHRGIVDLMCFLMTDGHQRELNPFAGLIVEGHGMQALAPLTGPGIALLSLADEGEHQQGNGVFNLLKVPQQCVRGGLGVAGSPFEHGEELSRLQWRGGPLTP